MMIFSSLIKRVSWGVLLMTASSNILFSQTFTQNSSTNIHSVVTSQDSDSEKGQWVQKFMEESSLEQKIGQLFMVAAYSGGENYNPQLIEKLIKDNMIGGLIFMQGTAEAQAQLTMEYQKMSKTPLLIGMDAEWGLGMRLTGVQNFPRQMMLGATNNPELARQLGMLIAMQCRDLGVHINFAPDVDVNNNPLNPVINFRSFGENRELVAKMGTAYMTGLQDNGVMACAKHFPGHGDVEVDSHLDLPIINKSKQQLDSMELFPFQNLIQSGVASIMTAHLSVPQLENQVNTPASLSKAIVTDLLIHQMRYKGLIITDALNMQGVTKFYKPGEVDVKAFMAGNDILLFSEDVPTAVGMIKNAIESGEISMARLEHSVRKIMEAKYDVGLHKPVQLLADGLTTRMNQNVERFKEIVARESITLVRDELDLLSKIKDPTSKLAYFSVNAKNNEYFDALKKEFPEIVFLKDPKSISKYDAVIVGVHNVSLYPGKNNNYNIDAEAQKLLKQVKQSKNTVSVLFGNAYALKHMCDHRSLIVTYEEHQSTYEASISLFKGEIKPQGILPVKACQ